jgi:negative regulator of sigma E activity
MNPSPHSYEEKLLEFAYGELPDHELRAVEAHLKGCARCTDALEEIRGVRRVMSALPAEPAPDAGLESLLAYAESAAVRNRAETKQRAPWRRWVAPMGAVAALGLVAVVSMQVLNPGEPASEAPATMAQAQKPAAEMAPATPPAPAPAEAAREYLAEGGEPEQQKLALADQDREAKRAGFKDRLPREVGSPGKGSSSYGMGPSSDPYRDQKNRPPKDEDVLAFNETKAPSRKSTPASNAYQERSKSKKAVRSSDEYADDAPAQAPAKESVAALEREWGTKSDSPGSGAPSGAKAGGSVGSVDGRGSAAGSANTAAERSRQAEREKEIASRANEARVTHAEEESRLAAESADDEESDVLAAKPSAPPPASARPPSVAAAQPSTRKAEAPSAAAAPSQAPASQDKAAVRADPAEVKRQLALARSARSKGDPDAEVDAAGAALQAGATGADRAEALQRLCELFDQSARTRDADPFCNALVREFPDTGAARATVRRRAAGRSREAAQPSQ